MPRTRSRSPVVPEDAELRLPRTPGVIRRFWMRHPLFADVLIALASLLLVGIVGAPRAPSGSGPGASVEVAAPIPTGVWITVALTLLGGVCVLLRRRRPILLVVVAAALETVAVLGAAGSGVPLLVIGLYSLAVYRTSRAAWIAFGVVTGAVLAAAIVALVVEAGSADMVDVFVTVTLGLIGVLIGTNIGNRRRWVDAIIDRSRQLLVERDQQAQLAAAAERARIAREMHDIVSHSLTVVVALAEGARATHDTERAHDAMDAAAATARSALTEMRAMLGVLRDDDGAAPLAPTEPAAPAETVAAAQRAGYPVRLTVSGDVPASGALRYAIGRIVQEGVTNAMRHAPGATDIAVRIAATPEWVTVDVVNDGAHAPRSAGGFGVRGLKERAVHVGGALHSGPLGGDRWMLRAQLPVEAVVVETTPTDAGKDLE